jgi:type VI secretion system secreted protein VgrG
MNKKRNEKGTNTSAVGQGIASGVAVAAHAAQGIVAATGANKVAQGVATGVAAAAQAAQTAAQISSQVAKAGGKLSDPGKIAGAAVQATGGLTGGIARTAAAALGGSVAAQTVATVATAASQVAQTVIAAASASPNSTRTSSPPKDAAPVKAPNAKTPTVAPAKDQSPVIQNAAAPSQAPAIKKDVEPTSPMPSPGRKVRAKAKQKKEAKAAAPVRDSHFLFQNEAYKTELEVLSLEGTESLSRPFDFVLELVTKKKELDPKKIVGQAATVKLLGMEGDRHIHGIVTRLELTQVLVKRSIYRAYLSPPLIKLGYRQRLQIFQKKTTEAIVTEVLKESGIDSVDQVWNTSKTDYIERDYCVQYRETDLDFVHRLLAEEGISYHFAHDEKTVKIVFNDRPEGHAEIEKDSDGSTNLAYSNAAGFAENHESIRALNFGQQMHVQRVELRDYEFSKPAITTVGKAATDKTPYAIYDYPGDFVESGLHGDDLKGRASKLDKLSNRRSQLKLEALAADSDMGFATSNSTRMLPGFAFSLGTNDAKQRHPRKWANAKYLLTTVHHKATQNMVLEEEGAQEESRYGNEIEFIPADKQLRPQGIVPKPRVHGLHTAVVIGPKNEEIYTDKYGRVKVRFHWQREKSEGVKPGSCWIRVSQGWGGDGWGAMFIPRVGQEVLVSFLEGDPDRPIVVGRVYNGEQPVPYELPKHKTRSTIKSRSTPGGGGFNEIRFEDKKGAEELFTHAQKDQNEIILNDRDTKIGRNQKLAVTKDRKKDIGGNEKTTVIGSRKEAVKEDESITIGKNRKRVVAEGSDVLEIGKGNQRVSVFEGERLVDVRKGTDGLVVHKKDRQVLVKEGIYKVTAKAKSIAFWAGKQVAIFGKSLVSIKSQDEVVISAGKRITLMVGANRITLDPKSIVINGIDVTSQAMGVQTIAGAVVKIN